MDASTRQDLVTLSLPPRTVASGNLEDPTISMSLKSQQRIETGDFPEDVEVFDLDSGEDEQIKLFNYAYYSRGIPSETPRTEQCAVDLALRFQGLAMEESDDEYAADNYTCSPKFSTIRNAVDSRKEFPLLETGLYRRTEIKCCFDTSEDSSKSHLDPPSMEHKLAINSAPPDLDKSRGRLSRTEVEYPRLEKHCIPASGPLVDSNSNQINGDISVDLYNLHLGTKTIVRPSSPRIDTLTAEDNCTAETITSLGFDLAAYSIIGVGSWIEYGTDDFRPLDVEVLGDFCLTRGHLKGPKDQKQHKIFTTCHGDSAAGSTTQNVSGASSSDSGSGGTNQNQLPPNGGRHHKHPSDGSNGAGEDDDPTQPKKAKTESGTNKRFVCPFHIHDPVYFNTSFEHGQRYTLCANGIGFPDIARMKEHLNRVHSPEIICLRCGLTFKKQHDLDLHLDLRNKEGPKCDVRKLPAARSMTPDMKAQLSSRGKRLSQEEQWFKIYQILFPNDPKPLSDLIDMSLISPQHQF